MNKLIDWFLQRLPIQSFFRMHFIDYRLSDNLNFWYVFGFLSIFTIALQILTGFCLVLFYIPTPEAAFNSVEVIMREIPYGWLFRYLHTTGASALFIIIYCHIFRSLIYSSYKKPRELVWILGVLLYLLLLIEAYVGYLLPWGQMSYWATQVISALLNTIPWIGPKLLLYFLGDSSISSVTLQRFFALHILAFPFLIGTFVWLHIIALRKVGSNNPQGEYYIPRKKLSFYPYYTIKELWALIIFLIVFFSVVCFFPEMKGYFIDANNFLPADPLQTPNTIKPLWYFASFYALLCAIPNKQLGILTVFLAFFCFIMLPWLDKNSINSWRYRHFYARVALALFCFTFFGLSFIGLRPLTSENLFYMRVLTFSYFLFFALLPFCNRIKTTIQVSDKILKHYKKNIKCG